MNISILKTTFAACAIVVTMFAPAQAADTISFTDDLGRKVEIPTKPTAIVSMHDSVLTIPLIELGVIPAGSHGRETKEGVPFIRSGKGLTGYDFDNSSIKFVGNYPADVEKVAAVKPDLIITTPWQKAPIDQLQAIAPTIVVDYNKHSDQEIFELLAKITGTTERFNVLLGRYEQQIKRIKRIIDTENITVNVMQPNKGQILVWNTYGNIGKVLRDAGFKFPQITNDIPMDDIGRFSAEKLQDLDADYVFATYRTDQLQSPKDTVEGFEQVVPGFCDYLTACKEGRMLVIPREEASSNSFLALSISAYTVLTHISGHPYNK